MEEQDRTDSYVFDFERLDVYQKAIRLVSTLYRLTKPLPNEYQFSVGDQLRRAGLSVANNIAEGSGKLSKKEKAHFYRTALNSTRECIPMLTVLRNEQQVTLSTHRETRSELLHVANMLGRLISSISR